MTWNQKRYKIIQWIRRSIQISVIILIVLLPFFSLYGNFHSSRSLDQISEIAGWRKSILSSFDPWVQSATNPDKLFMQINGNLWTLKINKFEIADPLAFAEVTAGQKKIHLPLLKAILIPILITLILGRVFCSWICPAYLIFEFTNSIRRILEKTGFRLYPAHLSHKIKYYLLAAGIATAISLSLPIFSLVYPPALISRLLQAFIFGLPFMGMVIILTLMITAELLFIPRFWCRIICPGGALYGLLGAKRILSIQIDPNRCTQCGACRPVCEEALDPTKESSSIECDNCCRCISACPEDALSFHKKQT